MSKKKVIIIGGGPAGLTAGYQLLKNSKDYDVTILEATNEIGGISRTVKHKGNRMDIGGQDVLDFWNEIMPTQGAPAYDDKKLKRKKPLVEGGPDPEKEDEVMLVRQRVSRIYYLKKFFDYPISMKLQTFKNMGLKRTMASGFSYLKSAVIKRPEDSLENFYINRFGKKLYSMFFEGYTEKLWGRHPRDISADWGAQRVKGLSISAVIKDMFKKVFHIKGGKVETSLIEEFIYPKYGPGQLWETVAKRIEEMGGTVIMRANVTVIKTKGNKATGVVYETKDGEKRLSADYVISSMPLRDLTLSLDADVPESIKEIADGLPYRDFVTVGLLVKKLNLKNETDIKTLGNIVPDCWIYVQDTDVKLGRIQIFNNWSPYMVKNPDKNIWIGLEYFCNEGDDFWKMSDKKCIEFATDELVKMGIISSKKQVLDSHRERVKKAYPAYFDTYKDIDKLIKYLNKFDNLYCVGRNGQHRYNNMDHSMVTSFETVKNILDGKKSKSNIWNVNTEKEYHEKK